MSVSLRKLLNAARKGCCTERISADLSMGGATLKLLRRVLDTLRTRAPATDAEAQQAGMELSALLDDMKAGARLNSSVVGGPR